MVLVIFNSSLNAIQNGQISQCEKPHTEIRLPLKKRPVRDLGSEVVEGVKKKCMECVPSKMFTNPVQKKTVKNKTFSPLAKEEWLRVAPIMINSTRSRGRRSLYTSREILDGILYRFSVNCSWGVVADEIFRNESLERTVARCYHTWKQKGIFEKLLPELPDREKVLRKIVANVIKKRRLECTKTSLAKKSEEDLFHSQRVLCGDQVQNVV